MARFGRKVSAGVGALVLMAGLSACTSGEATPDPTGSSGGTTTNSESPGPSPEQPKDPREIGQEIEDAVEMRGPELGLAGELSFGPGTVPAELAVVAVEASDASTRLVLALRSTSGEEEMLDLAAFNERTPLAAGIRDVSITDPVAEKILLPYLAFPKGKDPITSSFCLCSNSPKTLNDSWFTVYATMPGLDPSTSTVTVTVPGFEAISDVPVTRS